MACVTTDEAFLLCLFMTARQVLYSGHVQGVGFRASVKNIARGYEVTGSVKNLHDGRVELRAQSVDEDELQDFLTAIDESDLGSLVKEKELHLISPISGINGFTISREEGD
jgi:acylphosphatase